MFTALILTKPQNLLMLLGLFGQGQTRGPSWLELIGPRFITGASKSSISWSVSKVRSQALRCLCCTHNFQLLGTGGLRASCLRSWGRRLEAGVRALGYPPKSPRGCNQHGHASLKFTMWHHQTLQQGQTLRVDVEFAHLLERLTFPETGDWVENWNAHLLAKRMLPNPWNCTKSACCATVTAQ